MATPRFTPSIHPAANPAAIPDGVAGGWAVCGEPERGSPLPRLVRALGTASSGKGLGVCRCSQSYSGIRSMTLLKSPSSSRTAPRLLTVFEAAEFLRLSDKTVRRMITRGDLASHRIGRSLRLYEHDLRAFVSDRRQ